MSVFSVNNGKNAKLPLLRECRFNTIQEYPGIKNILVYNIQDPVTTDRNDRPDYKKEQDTA